MEIGDPGHGKDVVDGLNAIDKSYLGEKIIGDQKILPQLVKALIYFFMPLINQLLVFRTTRKNFNRGFLYCR